MGPASIKKDALIELALESLNTAKELLSHRSQVEEAKGQLNDVDRILKKALQVADPAEFSQRPVSTSGTLQKKFQRFLEEPEEYAGEVRGMLERAYGFNLSPLEIWVLELVTTKTFAEGRFDSDSIIEIFEPHGEPAVKGSIEALSVKGFITIDGNYVTAGDEIIRLISGSPLSTLKDFETDETVEH